MELVLERKVQLDRMTWPEVKKAIKEANGTVVIVIGATEQHGPHLPLCVDTLPVAEAVLRAAKKAEVVVAPPIPFGASEMNMGFPGTIALRTETLGEVLKDISRSLIRHGFDKIIAVSGHGGNYNTVMNSLEEIKYERNVLTYHVKIFEMAPPTPPSVPEWAWSGHGGAQETSMMLYLCPNDVDTSKYVVSQSQVELPKHMSVWSPLLPESDKAAVIMLSAAECSKYGHIGNPSFASKKEGEKIIESWANSLAEILRAIKKEKIKYYVKK